MKKILTAVLVLFLLVSMAACSVENEDVIGTWRRETLYMAYYNCETDMIVSFAEDGSFAAILLNHENNSPLNYAGGTWTLEEETIVAQLDDTTDTMEFTYNTKTKTVDFEGYSFEWVEEAE